MPSTTAARCAPTAGSRWTSASSLMTAQRPCRREEDETDAGKRRRRTAPASSRKVQPPDRDHRRRRRQRDDHGAVASSAKGGRLRRHHLRIVRPSGAGRRGQDVGAGFRSVFCRQQAGPSGGPPLPLRQLVHPRCVLTIWATGSPVAPRPARATAAKALSGWRSGRTRTPDLLLRRQLLYPAELRDRAAFLAKRPGHENRIRIVPIALERRAFHESRPRIQRPRRGEGGLDAGLQA